MRKKNIYMVVDTETCTLPFADSLANGNPELKKKIAISKALVYDIGWTLMYRDGTVFDKKQFLITETFSVPSVFNTAYYASKRPLYIAMMERDEIDCLPWRAVMEVFMEDLDKADFVGAFNSMFDFKKAIPFTELYISKLYSADYNNWERLQYQLCKNILTQPYKKTDGEFDKDNFVFRGTPHKLFDVWGMACDRLLNKNAYKDLCLESAMLTNSGEFFKTSAESAYRYLCKQYEFEEAHTALADAEIESYILSKILKKGKIDVGIDYFPFRKLGHTDEYVQKLKGDKRKEYARKVFDAMYAYLGLDEHDLTLEEMSTYQKRILDKLEAMRILMDD